MNRYSVSFFFLSIFLFSSVALFVPLPATADGIVPCGRTVGTPEEQAPCTLCHLIVGGKRVIDYGLGLMTFAAIAILVAMAIWYIVSAGDEGMMSTAKGGIKAALVGVVVMLSAWLIVSVVLTLLARGGTVSGLTNAAGGLTIQCDVTSLVPVP